MAKKITKKAAKAKANKAHTFRNELKRRDFRVTIFGSARIKENDKVYKQVFDLAKDLGKHRFDVITGGGPGLMEAANAGHEAGDKENISDSIGLAIKLPHEQDDNAHLDLAKHFAKFSDRLDNFMALSSVAVVMPGGVGSCLEFFYTWQLIQVKHIHPIPIILVGKMWKQLMKWVKKYPLKQELISPEEMECVHVVKDNRAAMKIIMKAHEEFAKGKGKYNNNYLKR
ncbi:LOG family protein [Candidatus Gracilibacteria bacterium]|nr:LOG family protein [Candidatus Gracilibacteria bacterium]